ncbi:MAG: hypothetical protein AB1757_00385 [Acidobacteriota bacterium]
MKPAIWIATLIVVLLCIAQNTPAQSKDAKPTGSISGQVTIDGKSLSHFTVGLFAGVFSSRQNPLITVTTDEEGRFQFSGIARGNYRIIPLTSTFIAENNPRHPWEAGKDVAINDGERIEEINFSLKRGGVITGRVTDANQQPIIKTFVSVWRFEEKSKQYQSPFVIFDSSIYETDDRGIYRIYGLPAGQYKVSAGSLPQGTAGISSAAGYIRTYHPDATDVSNAKVIELAEGEEVSAVDIIVALPVKTYALTGRIINAETGSPVAGQTYGILPLTGNDASNSSPYVGLLSNAKGEFRIDRLLPGRYAIFLVNSDNSEFYAERTLFEVKDADVKNLEIKALRGASISGTAVVEGTSDPNILAQLQKLQVGLSLTPRPLDIRLGVNPIAVDGSFRINGLPAGKAEVQVRGALNEKGFTLMRIEHNGVEKKTIEINKGEQISNVRLVLAYGTGNLRGQIKVENGPLPKETTFLVLAGLKGEESFNPRWQAWADARGFFVLNGMPTGEYEIRIVPRQSDVRMRTLEEVVRIVGGEETQYTFTFDVSKQLVK